MARQRRGLLSVVIPAFNEADNIRNTVRVIKELLRNNKIKNEIILIDDGSKDQTWKLIKYESHNAIDVIGIRFSRNFGKEAAIMAGLIESKGKCVVVIDCDLQHPPEKIVEMYRKWQDGYEIVEGIKNARGREKISNKIGAKVFYKIISKAMNIDMSNASDYKLLDRSAVKALINMPEKNVFFRALSSWIGYKTAVVKYDVNERKEGRSKWGFKKLTKYAISNITSFSSMPMQIITILGASMLLASIILTIIAIKDYITGVALGGFTTVIILVCFTSSTIMISLGILGYYISKIFEQVQNRPKFIIWETTRNEKS